MSKKLYADIIIDISSESLDKTYQYEIPEELLEKVQIGSPVEIPFMDILLNFLKSQR